MTIYLPWNKVITSLYKVTGIILRLKNNCLLIIDYLLAKTMLSVGRGLVYVVFIIIWDWWVLTEDQLGLTKHLAACCVCGKASVRPDFPCAFTNWKLQVLQAAPSAADHRGTPISDAETQKQGAINSIGKTCFFLYEKLKSDWDWGLFWCQWILLRGRDSEIRSNQ